jgi:DNA anti-recombination protein RmuC
MPERRTQARKGLDLIGAGLAHLLGAALEASPAWADLQHKLDVILSNIDALGGDLMALTKAQQQAVNELSEGVSTLAGNLTTVLAGAQSTRDALAAMAAEEGREQAERERLEALVAQMDADVVDALAPLTQQVGAMNDSLQTPTDQGGGPLTPDA